MGVTYPLHEGAAFRSGARRRKLARMRMSAVKWSELVSAWEASGQSARSYADEHGVSEGSLRWWKGELARRNRREPTRRSPGPGRHRAHVALAKVLREGEEAPSSTEPITPPVVIAIGPARILVEHDFDARLLRAIVHALVEQP
jgi:hypothetical protein